MTGETLDLDELYRRHQVWWNAVQRDLEQPYTPLGQVAAVGGGIDITAEITEGPLDERSEALQSAEPVRQPAVTEVHLLLGSARAARRTPQARRASTPDAHRQPAVAQIRPVAPVSTPAPTRGRWRQTNGDDLVNYHQSLRVGGGRANEFSKDWTKRRRVNPFNPDDIDWQSND